MTPRPRNPGGGSNTPNNPPPNTPGGRRPGGGANAGGSVSSAQAATTTVAQHGRPGGGGNGQGPTGRSNADLQNDLDPNPRPGETPQQAADRVEAAQNELALRQAVDDYNALGEDPPRLNIGENDAAHVGDGAHTTERHGPDVPLNRGPGRTIEGRIYGDPPWGSQENWSYRWSDASTMNRTVNDYIAANWDTIRSDLALNGRHNSTFDAGHRTGEGFYNEGMYGSGPRSAHYGQTSYATVRLELIPGNPPTFFVVTAFPAGRLP
jgi:hypothetical protein